MWSPALIGYVDGLGPTARRAGDPLTTTRGIMAAIHGDFEYAPNSTRVDSPIDEALAARRGVCQDFTHVMIAALRRLGLPCRYVSGYIAPRTQQRRTRTRARSQRTRGWRSCLPELGWVGLDPTHNMEAGVRHVRVAIGRDYADVPPTRGTFKGDDRQHPGRVGGGDPRRGPAHARPGRARDVVERRGRRAGR